MLKTLTSLALIAALVSACGSSDSSAGSDQVSDSASEATTTTQEETSGPEAPEQDASLEEESAFPVTVEHMMGSVTIEAKPIRVVTLGFSDTDIANALGAEIVAAVASPYGDDGLNPFWSPNPLDIDIASLSVFEVNLEAIAAANPDIILATAVYPATLEVYDQLSEIAPVIAPITGPLLDSADDLTVLIGMALGEQEAAAELLATTDVAVKEFAAANPELEGMSIVFAPREGGQTAVFIDQTAASVAFLAQLGLATPQPILDIEGDRYFGASFINDELLGVLDSADITIVGLYTDEDRTVFLDLPTIKNSQMVANGTMIEIGRPLAAALQSPNPVSILYVLQELGPQLVAAAK